MVILPCSIKTLSGIVNSYTDTLVTRAADVVLKERRPLVLCVRETPLHLGHLRLMTQAAELGAVIMPPVPRSIIVRKRWTMSSTRPLTACWISSISTCRKISLPAGRGVKLCTNKVHEKTICPVSGQNCNRNHILDI